MNWALAAAGVSAAVRAQVLPTQRLLLPKGAFIDCTLETAIDSTLPGMTTCIMATDTFGVDGKVVLLERGTKLIGETRGQVQQGSARVFVLWTEARTPTGVVVPLASPGCRRTGPLGVAGEGQQSLLAALRRGDAGVGDRRRRRGAVQSAGGGNGTVVVNPSATQGVMTEVLKGTINIPPTVVKQQGDRIQVLVARDLDFRSVYELRIRRRSLMTGEGIRARHSPCAPCGRCSRIPTSWNCASIVRWKRLSKLGEAGSARRCRSPISNGAADWRSWSPIRRSSASTPHRRCCRRRCRAGSACRS